MKKFLILLILFSAYGCASHSKITTPDLNSDLGCQSNKQVEKDVEVMMLAIHEKKALKTYFDDDLIRLGVLPVKVSIENLSSDPCFIGVDYAKITDPDGNSKPALNLDEVYDRTYKSYWRTAGWGVAFGLLGAVPSLINVATTNEKIKADYDTCMLKDGEMKANTYTEGTLFFEIDNKIQSLDGYKFQIGVEKDTEPFYFTFDLKGQVEQPRIRKVKEDE
jgi:hypothetical protein